jgi:hypothetical protein
MMSDHIIMAGAPSGLKLPDGVSTQTERVGNQNDRIVSKLHGDLWECASRGRLFHACSQAATTTTIALAAVYTGLCLSNPVASTVVLEVRAVGIALSVAPAGIATCTLAGGYAAGGVTVHTTPLVTYNCKLGNATAATGLADAAATLVGAPRDIMPLVGGFTAGALYPHQGIHMIQGGICIPAGGYVFIETLTVAIGFFGIWWAEWPA